MLGFASVSYDSRDLITQRRAKLTSQAALDLRLLAVRHLPLDLEIRVGAGLRALWLTQPNDSAVALQQGDFILPRLLAGVHRQFGGRGSLGLAMAVDRELFVAAASTQVLGAQLHWLVTPQLTGAVDLVKLMAWRLGMGGQLGYVVGFSGVHSGLRFIVDLRGTHMLSDAWSMTLALGFGQKSQSTVQVQQTDRHLMAGLSATWHG